MGETAAAEQAGERGEMSGTDVLGMVGRCQ
jgi:hypothetical protein